MVQVPDYQEFEALRKRVIDQENELNFLRLILVHGVWLNREQTMKALDVSDETLRRIRLASSLTYKYQGDHPFYYAYSVRDYLTAKNIEPEAAQKRVFAAFLTEEKPIKRKG